MKAKVIVYKEYTLGVIIEKTDDYIHIHIQELTSSQLKGTPFKVMGECVFVDEKYCRDATKKDFEDFRVKWNPNYEVVDFV